MPQLLFVVNNPDRWSLDLTEVEVVSARAYLSDPGFSGLRNCRVYNLCRSYRYQSLGYYVSLLAEARGHRPLPRIGTIQDLKLQSIAKVVTSDLDELIQKSLAPLHSDRFMLSIYFSRNLSKRYDRLSQQLFNLFPAPLLRAHFARKSDVWDLQSISPISANEVPEDHRPILIEFAREYFAKRKTFTKKTLPRYHLAILVGKEDPTPPSDEKALSRFVEAAESRSISVEIVSRNDYGRLAEFDALFIRQTTAVNNLTYRFARRAEAEGLVVIDDPQSIVRCTNKVFLSELLARHRISTPRTEILHRDNGGDILYRLGLPCILKQPDSSFSQGVVKVSTGAEFSRCSERLLEKSDLLIAQEFFHTEFDWRIGVIDQKPLYACKYYMAANHWQIYDHSKTGEDRSGEAETVPVELAPRHLVRIALKAANLIGDGLYGVDVKESSGKGYVIEVNDNPSIESGVEDKVLGEFLYERIMEVFLKRLERRRQSL